MKYMLLIALGLLVGSAMGFDWLGTPVYASPYYYTYPANTGIYYYPYTDYNAYIPDYPYSDVNAYIPVYSGNYLIPHTYVNWWPSHEGLEKTLSIAQTRSSMRVYSGGFWTSPSL